VAIIKSTNLAVKFGLELAALAAFAYWGTTLSGAALSAVVAVVVPVAMIVLWGRFAAPTSARRLRTAWRIPFELTVFGLAAAALLAAGEAALAVALVVITLANTFMLARFDQWEL
jgi:hypothetical protein